MGCGPSLADDEIRDALVDRILEQVRGI